MEFRAELGNYSTLKNGMKMPVVIDNEEKKKVLKSIYNFVDKPLTAEFIEISTGELLGVECEIAKNKKSKRKFKIIWDNL